MSESSSDSKSPVVLRRDPVYLSLVVAFIGYATLFIYRTSFTVNGERYFCLFDDAMISMRYAHNLASGYGLVFNPHAARVEGFTNLLWVLYMTLFHFLPVALSKMSLFIQISGGILLTLNLFFVRKIALFISGNSRLAGWLAVLFTASYLPLNNWGLQGMEVSALTFLTTLAVWYSVNTARTGKHAFRVFVILGISILVRMDMAVIYCVIMAYLAVSLPAQRRKLLTVGGVILLVTIVGPILFQYFYFGEFLPNTYYLKMTGYPIIPRILRGLYVTMLFFFRANPLLVLLPFAIVLFRRDRLVPLLLSLMLAQTAYSVYIGGDAWEWWGGSNRFISVVMPLFFVLTGYALALMYQMAVARVVVTRKLSSATARTVFTFIVTLLLVNINAIYGPEAISEWLLIKAPLHTEDNRTMVERALLLEQITNQDATVAVDWAGSIPYFSERYTIDLLGKNDREIAHEPMRVNSDVDHFYEFYPGHLKWNFNYSIGAMKPDVVIPLWKSLDEAKPLLLQYYRLVKVGGYQLFVRNGSSHVIWSRLPNMAG